MKTMLMFLLLLTIAANSGAQDPGAGMIVLSADPMGESCTYYDFPGLLSVYVVILDAPCLTACEFRVISPPSLIWINDTVPGPMIAIGNSQTGVSIGFGGFMMSPIQVMTITYFMQGLSGPCTQIGIGPDPAAVPLEILTADCNSNILLASGRGMMLNPTPDCDECSEIPIGTEKVIWGQVKALYSN